jgi:hypothetical protein
MLGYLRPRAGSACAENRSSIARLPECCAGALQIHGENSIEIPSLASTICANLRRNSGIVYQQIEATNFFLNEIEQSSPTPPPRNIALIASMRGALCPPQRRGARIPVPLLRWPYS